jgi:hypothetical protein
MTAAGAELSSEAPAVRSNVGVAQPVTAPTAKIPAAAHAIFRV